MSSECLITFYLRPVSGGISPDSLSLRRLILHNSILKAIDMKSLQKVEGPKLIGMDL